MIVDGRILFTGSTQIKVNKNTKNEDIRCLRLVRYR